jgi:ankyrin repeat protein
MASTIELNISKWELNEQLRLAAEFGLLDDVIQCLNDGAEIDSGDANDGLTALHWATYGGHDSVVDYICRHKGNINITNYFGSTPLQHACVMGHENIVRILLRHNVDTSIKDRDGYTPLDFALRNGHHTIVDLIKNYD